MVSTDKYISAAARYFMRGKAVDRINLVDNEGVEVINETRSKNTKEVFEFFKFAGVDLEMLTRRCNMYQRWARFRNFAQTSIGSIVWSFCMGRSSHL